ncbi:MAG: glycosyltransferase family 2 protein [Enorma sp.]|uniref:glycosyltransferase family 2 protein n=1 Tax=Enorma sp. TaxID=1920692 RepID=UPI00258A0989|nr:glycosyltransferase family 2 protein [Enorma sp.]MCI7775185.1 glycosyltransferase family 2 protein [Enorma sp.]
MKTLAIIPAYNEEASIAATIEELKQAVPKMDFLVINDGSRDNTRCICRKQGYNLLDLAANVGLTGGFQAGVKYALRNGYDAVLQFDADGQHVPQFINPMIKQMQTTESDIVIGSRFVTEKKDHSARMIGSRLISAMIAMTTGQHINDPTSGMRLFNHRAMEYFGQMNDFGPEPDSIAYLIRKGLTVSEVQVSMREREAGESYLNATRSIEYMLRTCISILLVQWFR